MNDLSPVNRPVLLREIAAAFDIPLDRLRRLARRANVRPACYIGPLPVYGARQVRQLHRLVVIDAAATAE